MPGDRRNDPEVEALYASAPDRVRAEIINGVVMMSPRPHTRHSFATSRLGAVLVSKFDIDTPGPGGGWIILDEPNSTAGPDPTSSDPTSPGGARNMPSPPNAAEITLGPDWICEVLSPSTEVIDRSAMMTIYVREGVGHVWLVDPVVEVSAHSARALRPAGTFRGDAVARVAPFEVVEISLGALWIE